jgi:hypothetical protein
MEPPAFSVVFPIPRRPRSRKARPIWATLSVVSLFLHLAYRQSPFRESAGARELLEIPCHPAKPRSLQCELGRGRIYLGWQFLENSKISNNFRITGCSERVQFDTVSALTMKVYKNLAAQLSYEVRYKSVPGGDDTDKTDTSAKAPVVYSFGSE